MTTMEKIENLMNDTAALEQMLNAATPDALIAALDANGIEVANVTKEEAYDIFQRVKAGELAEDELDEVAGGFTWSASGSFLTKIFGASATRENCKAQISSGKGLFGFAFAANLRVHQSNC